MSPVLEGRDGLLGVVPDGPEQNPTELVEIDPDIVDAGARVLVENGWARAYESRELAHDVLAGALLVAHRIWEAEQLEQLRAGTPNLTPEQNFAIAERLRSDASFTRDGIPITRDGRPMSEQGRDALLARADVHTKLATDAFDRLIESARDGA